jgi:hypothetical protein
MVTGLHLVQRGLGSPMAERRIAAIDVGNAANHEPLIGGAGHCGCWCIPSSFMAKITSSSPSRSAVMCLPLNRARHITTLTTFAAFDYSVTTKKRCRNPHNFIPTSPFAPSPSTGIDYRALFDKCLDRFLDCFRDLLLVV